MLSYKKLTEYAKGVSNKYIQVNNCGCNYNLCKMEIRRKKGRLDYQLIYVKSGELIVHDGSGDRILHNGAIYLFRPNIPQNYSIYDTPTTFYWIHFTGNNAEEMLTFFKESSYDIGDFPLFERYCNSAYLDFKLGKECSELLYEGELIVIFAKLKEKIIGNKIQLENMQKIRPAIEAMNTSLPKRLSNEELSALCDMNKYYFIKIFKKLVGLSPQQYYISLIIEKSKYLLENTRYNINEISRICGIDDSLYFSRLFKKHTGLSPTNYRKIYL